jgi:uncharacterized membrane protein YqgA involved in biofilm formation
VSGVTTILGLEISNSTFIFLHIVAGAVIMEVLSLAKGFDGAKPWLRQATHCSDRTIHLLNSILIIVIGAVVASAIVEPATRAQALTAGLGWVGLLNTGVAKRNQRRSLTGEDNTEKDS